MAWELMNEPRCSGDFSGSKLQHWIDRTAEFLKSVDPNHLVTVGTEGFFGSSTPGELSLDDLLRQIMVAALLPAVLPDSLMCLQRHLPHTNFMYCCHSWK